MRSRWHYICVILSCAFYCGCTSPSMRQLEQLEACVNDAPDSVLTVLSTADMPRWGERRAFYALLTVQAQDKSYIDVVDDSLIRVAADYYATSRDMHHRMLAYYYLARVQYNIGAYAQSIISASSALQRKKRLKTRSEPNTPLFTICNNRRTHLLPT